MAKEINVDAYFRNAKHRRSKTPTVLQMEVLECGAASLAMVLEYYGVSVSLEQLRVECGVSSDGTNAANVLRAARKHGLEAKGFRKEIAALKNQTFPAIIFWNFNHFVVLDGIKNNKVYINDPAEGKRVMPWEDFDKSFTGIVLEFKKGPSFVENRKRDSVLMRIWPHMRGTRSVLLYLFFLSFYELLSGMLMPVFSRFFTDNILISNMFNFFRPLISAMVAAGLATGVLSWFHSFIALKFNFIIDKKEASSFMRRVLRLPVEFYNQRIPGELSQRLSNTSAVSTFLSGGFIGVLINVVSVLFYGAIMFSYDKVLSVLSCVSILVDLVLYHSMHDTLKNHNLKFTQETTKLGGQIMTGLSMIESIKANGSENDFFNKWSGQLAKFSVEAQLLSKMNLISGIIGSLTSQLLGIALLIVGAQRIMEGNLSIGMLMSFQSIQQTFLGGAGGLTGFFRSLQGVDANLKRLDDVHKYPLTKRFKEDFIIKNKNDPDNDESFYAEDEKTVRVVSESEWTEATGETENQGENQGESDENPDEENSAATDGEAGAAESSQNQGESGDKSEENSEEKSNPAIKNPDEEILPKLKGYISLKNISFGYSITKPALLNDLNIEFKPGCRIALVGGSGSGKSTIGKLVSSLYNPWSGELFFDGVKLNEITREQYTKSVAVVDQDIFLFEGDIKDNLTMWDDSISEDDMIKAAKDACIYDVIMERPGGFYSEVIEHGSNFSGGQKQRLEIARALCRNPTILIMDEATSALDAVTEAEIDANIRKRGCACLIIAHRLSTIRDSDEIIVLDHGKVIQRGTHDQLISVEGHYADLIKTM